MVASGKQTWFYNVKHFILTCVNNPCQQAGYKRKHQEKRNDSQPIQSFLTSEEQKGGVENHQELTFNPKACLERVPPGYPP